MLRVFIVIYVNQSKTSVQPFHPVIKEVQILFIQFIMIFGVLLLSLIYLGHAGLCLSLMIVLKSLGSSYLNQNFMSFVFLNFHNMIKNQFGVEIKRFRFDKTKDYFNQVLTIYFQLEGIIHQSLYITTPQQNGVTKRKNGHLLMQYEFFCSKNMCLNLIGGEVVLTTIHLINQLPSKTLGFRSPMEILSMFYHIIRTTNHLIPKIFECVSFIHVHSDQNKGKLDSRAVKYIFVRYSSTQQGNIPSTLQKNFCLN